MFQDRSIAGPIVGVIMLVVGLALLSGCSGRKIVKREAWNLNTGKSVITISGGGQNLLLIKDQGRIWEWLGSPEDAMTAVIEFALKKTVELEGKIAACLGASAKKKKFLDDFEALEQELREEIELIRGKLDSELDEE